MSKTHKLSSLTLETREAVGTTASQALRATGKIPGVVYGHGGSTPVIVDAKALTELLLSGNRSHIVSATIGGKKDSVLLRRIETDPVSRKPLSVDFQRVSADEEITSTVNVTVKGTPVGVKDQGGVLDVVLHTLDIRGPASKIPDQLEIDVEKLNVHEHLTAGQVQLPKGFALVTAPDHVVISVETHRGAEIPETAAPALEETPADTPAAG